MRRVLRVCGAALIVCGLLASPAMADPVGPGTLTPISLQGGGTIGGSITFDGTGSAVTGWDILVSGGTFGSDTYTSVELTSANSQIFYTQSFAFGGLNLSLLSIFQNGYTADVLGTHSLGLYFDQIPSVIPSSGVALAFCSDVGRVCQDTGSGIGISSGDEMRTGASTVGIRDVTSGFFTVSDPPGSLSLNFTETSVLIPVSGDTGGGGTGTPVPEPATMSLFALGAALAVGAKRNRRKDSLAA
jgi:hypothetical protein